MGPEVLAADAENTRQTIKEFFARQEIDFSWPIEWEVFTRQQVVERGDLDIPGMMYEAIVKAVQRADALVANISPFRGPHMYCVTAFAIGLATALRKPIFGWTNSNALGAPDRSGLRHRHLLTLSNRLWCGDAVGSDGRWRDEQGYVGENFDLPDCAALVVAVEPVHPSIDAAVSACAAYLSRQAGLTPLRRFTGGSAVSRGGNRSEKLKAD
jgi:nucleoside 2-deoxyribosyltransferase